jgi:2-polyprenyl-6-methoxyphenol hydroxylase-like FAD-dependent oxidoreductase
VTSRKHAIVLGASMGGLMAARVLSQHFEQVTVLDRDRLPSTGLNRKGVPQGHHSHVLLSSGCSALERLFPGIVEELVQQRGALDCAIGTDLRFFNEGQPLPGVAGDLRSLFVSRAVLEAHVRERVSMLGNVRIQESCEALELIAEQAVVRGVRVKNRDAGEVAETLAADLVVDATGRGSRLAGWLRSLGFDAPPEERARIDLGYASCIYRRRPDQAGGYKGLVVAVAPPNRRAAVALAQEDDRWIVTLVGYLGDHAQPTHEGMREYARGLPSPAIYELLRDAEPLAEPVSMRFPFSQRRHYEQLKSFPEGLLAIGDTLCSFNPSFGQGMSVAALEALLLQDCLLQGDRSLWKRLFRESAKLIDTPWTIAVGADLGFPEVEGKRTAVGNLLGRYVRALRRGAVHDEQLAGAFLRVAQLIDPPAALLAPRLVLRTLRASRVESPMLAAEPRQRESFAG